LKAGAGAAAATIWPEHYGYNLTVRSLLRSGAGKSSTDIHASAAWKKAVAKRPKHLDEMNAAEKTVFNAMLDRKFKPQREASNWS
jgi:hypothetical protein